MTLSKLVDLQVPSSLVLRDNLVATTPIPQWNLHLDLCRRESQGCLLKDRRAALQLRHWAFQDQDPRTHRRMHLYLTIHAVFKKMGFCLMQDKLSRIFLFLSDTVRRIINHVFILRWRLLLYLVSSAGVKSKLPKHCKRVKRLVILKMTLF